MGGIGGRGVSKELERHSGQRLHLPQRQCSPASSPIEPRPESRRGCLVLLPAATEAGQQEHSAAPPSAFSASATASSSSAPGSPGSHLCLSERGALRHATGLPVDAMQGVGAVILQGQQGRDHVVSCWGWGGWGLSLQPQRCSQLLHSAGGGEVGQVDAQALCNAPLEGHSIGCHVRCNLAQHCVAAQLCVRESEGLAAAATLHAILPPAARHVGAGIVPHLHSLAVGAAHIEAGLNDLLRLPPQGLSRVIRHAAGLLHPHKPGHLHAQACQQHPVLQQRQAGCLTAQGQQQVGAPGKVL